MLPETFPGGGGDSKMCPGGTSSHFWPQTRENQRFLLTTLVQCNYLVPSLGAFLLSAQYSLVVKLTHIKTTADKEFS